MVSDERYYDYMGRRLREEREKEAVIKEEHTHTNMQTTLQRNSSLHVMQEREG